MQVGIVQVCVLRNLERFYSLLTYISSETKQTLAMSICRLSRKLNFLFKLRSHVALECASFRVNLVSTSFPTGNIL